MSKKQVEKIQGEHLKKLITIFVGFIHDFAAGCWAATVLAIYWINNLQSKNPELAQALAPLEIEFFYTIFSRRMGRTARELS